MAEINIAEIDTLEKNLKKILNFYFSKNNFQNLILKKNFLR